MRASGVLVAAVALVLGAAIPARGAGSLSIAAASKLTYALEGLNEEYEKASPGVRLTTSVGASGSLVAQIGNGAPYDVFLSADLEFAQSLVRSGRARAASLTPFAVGRLVLWTVKPGVEVSDIAALVRDPKVRALAIANTDSAPYGRAAMQALTSLGIWAEAQPKLVTAENISQATQFVETGNADAGFVALSAVLSPRLKGRGLWAEVPQRLYAPIVQAAVITFRGEANPEAARYIAFLRGEAAGRVLRSFGYALPETGS